MLGNKKDDLSSEQFEDLVHEAMKGLGWVLPVTAEDVARVEAELDNAELPAALANPYAIFDGTKPRPSSRPVLTPSNDDVAECLARVAREGKMIPPEIEARMRNDRERAERGAND